MTARFFTDLRASMSGPLVKLAGGLIGADDGGAVVLGPALLDAVMLNRLMAAAGERARAPDKRAVASVWTLEYFEVVIPPILSAAILLGCDAAPAFEQAGFVVRADGRIAALRATETRPVDREGRFDAFIIRHLAPFVAHAGARGAVTARVLWSNAGHIFEAFLGMLERERGEHAAIREARALIASPTLRLGAPNPLFQPVRYEAGRRIRRVCCLRFLVAEWRICAICPLPPGHPSRAR